MRRNLLILGLSALLVIGFASAYVLLTPDGQRDSMSIDGMEVDAPTAPPVRGYFDGEDIAFIHPEASDPEVAEMLTEMMESPVIAVPHLAEAGDAALAEVSVFTSGVEPEGDPMGPFGFQADIFDSVPSDEAYSPLRRVVLVTWQDGTAPRILRSVQEINAAESGGEVTVERTEVVVNMPVVAWSDGER